MLAGLLCQAQWKEGRGKGKEDVLGFFVTRKIASDCWLLATGGT